MSEFFLDQRTADLGPGKFDTKSLQTIIANARQGMQDGSSDGLDGLLAAILATQARSNGEYRVYPFFVAAGKQLQILPQNDGRVGLIVAINTITTTPVAGILLDQGPLVAATTNDNVINRCVQINTALQTVMQFEVAPTNFVTMVACNGIDVRGVIFEAY